PLICTLSFFLTLLLISTLSASTFFLLTALLLFFFFFFFNDPATTEIYTLSLHDALPIFEAPDPRPRSADVRLHDHREAEPLCRLRRPGRVVDDAGPRVRQAEVVQQRQL